MSLRSHALIYTLALALTLACGLAPAFAAAQYAVTASSSKVFLTKYESGTVSNYVIAELNSSTITGVGTWGEYVFLADAASAGDASPRSLRVGKVVDAATPNPTIHWLGDPIPLSSGSTLLKQPGAVAVDSAGEVYVLGGRWNDGSGHTHSSYARVTSLTPSDLWADTLPGHVSVSITDLPTTTLIDIAVTEDANKAVIALQDTSTTWDGMSCVLGVATNVTHVLNDTGYFPQGIAMGKAGYSYMLNSSTELDPQYGPDEVGSISVITDALAKAADAVQLGSFRPTDAALFTVGTDDFLGVVGVTSGGVSQAWKMPIQTGTALPLAAGAVKVNIDISNNHSCGLSLDGSLFFVTSPQAGTVAVFDTATWTKHASPALGAPVGYISPIDPVMGAPTVPAPILAELPTQLYFVGRPFVGPRPLFTRGKDGSTFTLDPGSPAGMVIDGTTGIVSWPVPMKNGPPSTPYTITLRATNAGGSDTTSFVLGQFPKQADDDDTVVTGKVIVTGAFSDAFCIESADRLWGMLVMKTGHGQLVNRIVEVRGVMHTNEDGVRYIQPATTTASTQTSVLLPIYIPMRSLGGGDFLRTFGPTSGQMGVTGGSGANNVGLYVKVSGRVYNIVSETETERASFMLDDGSGVATTVHPYYDPGFLLDGDKVTVTGISTLIHTGSDAYERLIKARDDFFLQFLER